MIVIFLDVDGVILPFDCQNKKSDCGSIFPNCTLAAMTKIMESFDDVKLVLSSTWRVKDSFCRDIIESFHLYGRAHGGPLLKLDDFYDITDPALHSERQHEIHDWLQRQDDTPAAWIALDDEELLEGEANHANRNVFQAHVIKTDSHEGLTMKNACEAIELIQAQLQRKIRK